MELKFQVRLLNRTTKIQVLRMTAASISSDGSSLVASVASTNNLVSYSLSTFQLTRISNRGKLPFNIADS